MDPHCFDADPDPDQDPAQNLDADPDPDPDPGGGEGVGQQLRMCIPPDKILGTPLIGYILLFIIPCRTVRPPSPISDPDAKDPLFHSLLIQERQ